MTPFHKNPLLILSIFFIAHFFKENTVMKYVGMEDSTVFSSFSLPALFKNLPFQDGNLLANYNGLNLHSVQSPVMQRKA
jgi:hypothetical protein